jgi:hypothetical protein
LALASYSIALDAKSLFHHAYAARLVEVMAHSENQRVAVIQTPYRVLHRAPGLLERPAGASRHRFCSGYSSS